MAGYNGNYTRGGDPEAMFDEELRYLSTLMQAAVPVVDADLNDQTFAIVTQLRRIIEVCVGDGSPNDGFKVEQSAAPANNFVIRGGGGTGDTAGRLFENGLPAVLFSDVEYTDNPVDPRMKRIMPQVTALSATVLTDSAANWTVNELVGRTLTPNIDDPATTFTVLSNTATTITVTAGDMTVGASAFDHYRLELSTPSGGARVDEVYLDLFLDEVDDVEDTNLIHTDLVPNQAAAFRLVLRQYVRVKQGGTTPADFVDSDGRQHYTVKIATLNRLDATADVLTAQITDERAQIVTGGALRIREADGSPNIFPVTDVRVTNGTLTDLGGGSVALQTGGGGGGGVATGDATISVVDTAQIPAVTPPTPGTLGNFDTEDYPNAVTTGKRFDILVPDDYDSGDLQFKLFFAMSTAVAGDIRAQVQAEIAIVGNGIDTATYPAADITFTPPNSTDNDRQVMLTIAEGDFAAGDRIQFYFRRLGGDVLDTHTGILKVISYDTTYTSQIATRELVQSLVDLQPTDELSATPGSKGNFDTLDFSGTADNEQKVQAQIPENWDGVSDIHVRVTAAMATALADPIVLATEIDIANPGAAVVALPPFNQVVIPGNTTDIFRSPTIRTIPAAQLVAGGKIEVKLARRSASDGNDTHTGALQLLSLEVITGIGPKTGFQSVLTSETYLEAHNFRTVAGAPFGTQDVVDAAGDFEAWLLMTGAAPGDQINVEFQGRLRSEQSTIKSIAIPLRGTGDYRIRVYVEGQGASNVYIGSALLAAPGARTVTTILDTDLSNQPTGEKRFHVVVEATLDAAETLRVGRPFVRQE